MTDTTLLTKHWNSGGGVEIAGCDNDGPNARSGQWLQSGARARIIPRQTSLDSRLVLNVCFLLGSADGDAVGQMIYVVHAICCRPLKVSQKGKQIRTSDFDADLPRPRLRLALRSIRFQDSLYITAQRIQCSQFNISCVNGDNRLQFKFVIRSWSHCCWTE